MKNFNRVHYFLDNAQLWRIINAYCSNFDMPTFSDLLNLNSLVYAVDYKRHDYMNTIVNDFLADSDILNAVEFYVSIMIDYKRYCGEYCTYKFYGLNYKYND